MSVLEEWMNTVQCMDCLEGMKQLPDGCVDLVVTDPPYGINKDFGYRDNWRPDATVWRVCFDKLRDDSFLVLTVSNRHLPFWFDNLERAGFEYAHTGVYWNRCRAGGNCYGRFAYAWEPILYFAKGNIPKLRKRMLTDIFSHTGKTISSHPTEKDFQTWKKMIDLMEGDTILDPFMGSGTTALACKQLGRRFIGFEINPKYVEICNQRLAQEVMEL